MTDTPYHYCLNKAATEGSNLYYATLFENSVSKTQIITLQALLIELSDIIYECSDPGVARIKLKWWQEEIERLFQNQARHPVTQQMQTCLALNQTLETSLYNVIESMNQFIYLEQVDTLDDILAIYRSTAGEIWYQCGQQLNQGMANGLESLKELGAVIHFIHSLQQPNTYIYESRCIVPSDYAQLNQLLELRIEKTNIDSVQKKIFSPILEELKTILDKTYVELLIIDPVIFRHALILNRLCYTTCHEILNDGSHLLDRNLTLTPIRKLWIAWRTRYFN